MTEPELRDHELVVYAFAPRNGPDADVAQAQLRGLWTRSRSRLGARHPVAGTGLPTTVPADVATGPPGAIAAQEGGRCRLVLRRVQDTLALSMAFAAPLGTGRLGTGRLDPVEFDRWWLELAADGTDALSINQVYQSTVDGDPLSTFAGTGPFAHGLGQDRPEPARCGVLTVWEWGGAGDPRRLVVVAPAAPDAELNAWSGIRADVAVPSVAGYLLQVAELTYRARSWREGRADRVRATLDHGVGRLREALSRPGRPGVSAGRRQVLAALTELTTTRDWISDTQQAVNRLRGNLYDHLTEPLPTDLRLADDLLEQLAIAAAALDGSRQRAAAVSADAYNGQSAGRPAAPPWPSFDGDELVRSRAAIRMGFAVDIVEYSPRPAPLKDEAQQRLAGMVDGVLTDLGFAHRDTERQDSGDGVNLFLPPEAELHRALPELLFSWHRRVSADNDEHADRLRLRLAVGVGPVGRAALGFGGNTIIEVNRLLDSDAIRAAVQDHPERDLVVLVSDFLYRWVVGEGHPELDATWFQQVEATAKRHTFTAWLWSR